MPKFVIHAGPHKTGSTYLQVRFAEFRSALSDRSIIYPSHWSSGNQPSQAVLFRRLRERDPSLAAEFAALTHPSHQTVLISSEDLADLKPDELCFLRDLVGQAPVELVFYCRRWSELLASGWQEMVKHGYTAAFPEFFSAAIMNPIASHMINFQIRLERFAAVFGRDAIRLVSYNHVIDRGIDLFVHFAENFLDWRGPLIAPVELINASLSPVEAETIRALHALGWARFGLRDPQLFLQYLRAKETLDTGDVSAAMERDMQSLILNEDAPGLRLLHQQLFQSYGDRLVEPRSGQALFGPKRAQLPFVGQNYLLAEGVTDALGRIYGAIRGVTVPAVPTGGTSGQVPVPAEAAIARPVAQSADSVVGLDGVVPGLGAVIRVIAVTMVYNEGAMLQKWLRHYGSQVGPQNLLVIDHGSDDGSTSDLGAASRINLPRDAGFDDGVRADFVSGLQALLLKFYDVVVFTDCDEFLIPDPLKYKNLIEYSSLTSASCVRPVGLDVFHDRRKEPPLDLDMSILIQRKYCRFFSEMCKPLVTREPVRWVAGFHAADKPAKVDPELFLLHLKYADYDIAMRRADTTRAMKWTERAIEAGWGKRHRASAEELTRSFFDAPSATLARKGAMEFRPDVLAESVNQRLVQAHGFWRCPPLGGDVFMRVPDRLRTAL